MTPSPADDLGPPLDFAAISTHASVLRDQNRLVLRYSEAILAYATALLKDRHEAEDVHMLVVQNMLEHKFAEAAAPGGVAKDRFRFYVQRSVHNAVLNHQRQRSRAQSLPQRFWNALFARKGTSGEGPDGPAAPPAEADLEEVERGIWRESVLRRVTKAALKDLEDYERAHQDGPRPNVYHTLARLLIDHAGDNSEQLAQRLGEQVGGDFNAGQTRGIILRMRKKLAELLVEEIFPQLADPSFDDVLDELGELGLLVYVKPYLPAEEASAGGA